MDITQQYTSAQYTTALKMILIYLRCENHEDEMMVEPVISKSDEKLTIGSLLVSRSQSPFWFILVITAKDKLGMFLLSRCVFVVA
jgi:hypothetical protein